jgi:hypothetical protein
MMMTGQPTVEELTGFSDKTNAMRAARFMIRKTSGNEPN